MFKISSILSLMQKYNHIRTLFFLGIFSMFLLHQAIPHLHHQHEVKHSHKTIAHNDSNSHQHDSHQHDSPKKESSKKESSKKGILDLFLEIHMHTVVFNEILLTHENNVKLLDVKKSESLAFSFNHYRLSINDDETEKIEVYHPPNNYFNPYLSFLYLRGPPSLG